ncbi:putative isoflavone reductase family protein [Lophium mytilinum]|uniref:Putative isoflavone reductase family protein n=1 Tax=Lophium mytilinum TaxID=390894 RepID=A0A6A6QYQ3_9PEZI|nr:putative isoflavone reductase family protein [Lophium mytilinum]
MSGKLDILVFGGTGVIGQYIVNALLAAKEDFGRLAIFTSQNTVNTKSDSIQSLREDGLEIIVGDVRNEEDVVEAYKGFNTVVSAVGRNVIAEQINLIRLAEQSPNIIRFFPSEYGTDIEYFDHSVNEKPHQLKLKVRAYIKESVRRLEYTYLVTGPYADLYLGNMGSNPVGSWNVKEQKAVLLGSGKDPVSLVTMSDVGKLLVGALKHPDVSRNRALKVNSFTATPDQILAEFERQTGKKWEASYTPLDKLKQLEKEAWDKGDPIATLFTLRRIWTEGGTLYKKRDNEKLGVTDSDTLEIAVAQAIEHDAPGYRSGKM